MTATIVVDDTTLKVVFTVEKVLTGISVADGYKTDYAIGATFDYNDLKGKLTLAYNDGSTEAADITGAMLNKHGAAAGENIITVTYRGFTAEMTVKGVGEDSWNADGDGEIRANLPSINIANLAQMNLGTIASAKGDTVAFGPSAGNFGVFATTERYDSYRMEFDSKIEPTATDANQRILLRASVADNDKLDGYSS